MDISLASIPPSRTKYAWVASAYAFVVIHLKDAFRQGLLSNGFQYGNHSQGEASITPLTGVNLV